MSGSDTGLNEEIVPFGTLLSASFAGVAQLVRTEMAGVEATIRQNLNSDVATVAAIGKHIVESGGKRLRPMMAILVGRALGHSGPELITLAVLLEFLHTATLLHDDVVDVSQRRRGHKTVNLLWGNAPSVLVGDFLYSRAFQLMVELNHMQVMTVISDATNTIAEGEVKQLENVGNPDLTEAQYMDIIRCKSALLFQAATETGAVVANASSDEVEAARLFGLHFGLAYQLMDDLLDYAGDNDTLGKNVGDDLAEGKSTLPLIFAMRYGSGADAALIRQAIESKSTNDARRIIEVVRESGALGYVRTNAIAQTNLAKGALVRLPPNRYQDGLINLADIALERLQ